MLTRFNGPVTGVNGRTTRPRVRGGMAAPPTTPPSGGTVTQAMIDFRAASLARPESEHNMAEDGDMQREMVLLTHVLAPRAGATHVAVQDGNWTAASTWLNSANEFEVPPAGANILIPQGITVTFDNNTTTAYNWIRHDGTLAFVTNANTQLYVDTIVSDHNSVWQQGTVATPIPAAYTSTVTFTDTGNLNPAVDELLIGRGWVSMGTVRICGAEKTHLVGCHQTRSMGDTTFTLNSAPTGWAAGDEITIGGTTLRGFDGGTFNEPHCDHTTVSSILGTTLTVPPIAHARNLEDVRTHFADAEYYIGNYTRNITFRSPPGTLVHRRGHVMWMHADIDARWCAYNLLGRTRKDIDSANATDDASRIAIMGSDIDWAFDSNVRGRYNFHIHRAGVGAGQTLAEVRGVAASDAPGWLYAHHSSYANFTDCVGRRYFGAGLMAEQGDEVGSWTNCLFQDGFGRSAADGANEKSLTDIRNGEFGMRGSAFWFRSRVIQLINPKATDCDNIGVWVSRGKDVRSDPFAADQPFPRMYYSAGATSDADQPILFVKGLRTVACRIGLLVIKGQPEQGHTLRSAFFDFLGVNLSQSFIAIQYTGKYSFRDIRVHGVTGASKAIQIGIGTVDMVLQNLTVRGGWDVGVWINSGANNNSGSDWENTFVNYDHGAIPDFELTAGGNADFPWTLQDYIDRTIQLETSDIQVRPLTWVPAAEPFQDGSQTVYALQGTLTDSIRVKNRNFDRVSATIGRVNIRNMLSEYGFWTYSGSKYLLVPDVIADTLLDSSGDLQTRYLTLVLRVGNYETYIAQNSVVDNGALAQRYVDAILIGAGTPPGTPDANAGHWVVYEDILA